MGIWSVLPQSYFTKIDSEVYYISKKGSASRLLVIASSILCSFSSATISNVHGLLFGEVRSYIHRSTFTCAGSNMANLRRVIHDFRVNIISFHIKARKTFMNSH